MLTTIILKIPNIFFDISSLLSVSYKYIHNNSIICFPNISAGPAAELFGYNAICSTLTYLYVPYFRLLNIHEANLLSIIILSIIFTVLVGLGFFTFLKNSKLNLYQRFRQLDTDRQLLTQNFEHIFNNTSEIVLYLDERLNIIDINARAAKILNVSKEDLIGKNIRQIKPTPEEEIERIRKILNRRNSILFETSLQTERGLINLEINAIQTFTDGKKILMIIVRDITDKKNFSQKIENLNRALKILSECNRSLVKAKDEKTLIKEICNLIVEKGGYNFSWIGYTEEDQNKMIVPAEFAGAENGLLSNYTFTWKDDQAGNNPAGIAVLTGKSFICNDSITNNLCENWKSEAAKSGIASTIALPLMNSSKTFGVLNICSNKPNAFTSSEEIEILEELAGDLAYGINALREQEKQRRISLQLEESEERYRNFFNDDLTGDFISTADGKILVCNPAFVKILRYSSADELLNKNASEIYYDRSKRDDFLKELKEKGRLEFYEIDLIAADGSKITVVENVLARFNAHGEIYEIVGYLFDITAKKEAEKQLVLLSKAVEQSPATIMITDQNGAIEYVNPKFEEITGYSSEEVLGKDPRILRSGLTPPDQYKEMWSVILSGKLWRGEFLNKTKHGAYYWEDAAIVPIINGGLTHFLAIKEDITARKKMTVELIEAKEKAEKSDRLKSEFLAQISHEIRTPLHAMLNLSSIIKEEVEETNFQSDILDRCFSGIRISSKRIIRTVDMIVNMSQLQTGNYSYSPKHLNLYDDLLAQIYLEFKTIADDLRLNFSLEKLTDELNTTVDDYSVIQIFNQLIDNAIKFTPQGKITIRLFRDHSSKLTAQIEDTGIGIAENYMPHLFTPFSQEEQGYSRSYDGNGLGLALVKKYCDLNNIQIDVKSKKGIGTTITLTFPG